MQLPDVNVLPYAFRREFPEHLRYRRWLEKRMASDASFGLSELVLSAFVRIVTTRRSFQFPESTETALAFAHYLKGHSRLRSHESRTEALEHF